VTLNTTLSGIVYHTYAITRHDQSEYHIWSE